MVRFTYYRALEVQYLVDKDLLEEFYRALRELRLGKVAVVMRSQELTTVACVVVFNCHEDRLKSWIKDALELRGRGLTTGCRYRPLTKDLHTGGEKWQHSF